MSSHTLLKTTSKAAIFSIASAILMGCGGGDSGSTVPPFTRPPPTSFNVSGTVTGLNGPVDIVVNGTTITQDVDGGFEFVEVVETGGDVTISLNSDPFGQTCVITGSATQTNVTSNITGVVVDCVNISVVNASVKNFFTGEGITAAEVSLSRQEGDEFITETATVNDAGIAVFEVPLSARRLSLNTDPVGFGAQSVIIDTPGAGVTAADMFVLPVDVSITFDNAIGADVMVGEDTLATVPANGFVDASGTQVVGDVNLELTIIDPSQSVALMPGDFLAQDPTSNEVSQIESFGALDLTFEDAAGNPVQLAADRIATLRIPVAERVSADAPDSIPLYSYDEETGYWIEEGSADLMTLPSGEQAYEGTVAHFTTWNADIRSETVEATGCVVDSDGQPVDGVRIRSEGDDYIGSSRATSNAQGVFTIPVRANSSQRLSAFRGSQSRTIVERSGSVDFIFANASNPASCLVVESVRNTVLGGSSATITLSWGENPSDLDSHLFGVPEVATDDNIPFEIAFTNREETVNGQTIFLDVDDVTSFGPEIITIPSFPYEGVYTFGVDLFTGDGTIASSPARVEVNLGGNITVFGPPNGTPTRCWAVSRFIVDGQGGVTSEPIGTWENRSYCTDGVGILNNNSAQKAGFGSGKVRTKPAASGTDSK